MSAFRNANVKKPLQLIFSEEVVYVCSFLESKKEIKSVIKTSEFCMIIMKILVELDLEFCN